MIRLMLTFVWLSFFVNSPLVVAGEARIAVASNFTHAIEAVALRFQEQYSDKLILIFGGTGKFYAQIINGAPFDAFFAADIRRPALLEQQGIALQGSRFTYAQGKIVLFSPKMGYVDATGAVLKKPTYHYLAIANPKLAPYGEAAKQVLEQLNLWETMQFQLVRGENIGQAYQFVMSGNAELGFVALSQIKRPGIATINGSYWKVPANLYQPIKQQAVLLSHNPVAKAFMTFVQSDEAKAIIQDFGYEIP
ncbi:molybdenum ABC transporter, periplasmic molybdate-binding protein [Beggiatoa sp. PS]|nr:molybdenum ABC transporter, periplasmic molybdate-binding protein [Beggiatoa sp. PS]